MKTLQATFLIGALGLGMNACSQNATPGASGAGDAALGPTRVAMVNGQPIAESVLRVYALATERKNLEELSPEDRERLLNDLIGVELLSQQAEKDGLTNSRTLAAQLELQRLQFVARSMATSYLEDNPATESEIQQIYEENLPRLAGQQYKARHILVETQSEAEAVIAQLRAGGDFVALAQERADGPTGPNGGALDWFTADSMPLPFADAVRALSVGSYSTEPVQTEFGFHVVLLEDTRQQEPPALADMRADLASAVERKRLDDYLKALRDAATVSVEP
jgi:peptidyl-prolyl cis-trans isomerase C